MASIVLLFVWTMSSVKCFDWCSLIAPNGQYNGLTLYNRVNINMTFESWMNNRNGKEWTFDVTSEGEIRPDERTVRNVNQNFLTRFVLISRSGDNVKAFECEVIAIPVNMTSEMTCYMFDGSETKTGKWKFSQLTNRSSSVFVGPYLIHTFDPTILVPTYLELDPLDRNKLLVLFFQISPPYFLRHCQQQWDKEICDNWFAKQLSDDLFASLDSSLKYNDSQRSEDILWFNVNDRPMYCFQKDRIVLSDGVSPRVKRSKVRFTNQSSDHFQCKSTRTLMTAFDECFPQITTFPEINSTFSSNNSTTTEIVLKSSKKWLIVSIVIFVVAVVLLVFICVLYIRFSKTGNNFLRKYKFPFKSLINFRSKFNRINRITKY